MTVRLSNQAAVLQGAQCRPVFLGAVPLAAALSRSAVAIGWPSFVVDPRERFADAQLFPDAERVVVAWPADALVAQVRGLTWQPRGLAT